MLQMINEAEIKATWAPIIESATGISDTSKLEWMSKYCHFHKLAEDSGMVNESVYNYVHMNPGMNVPGMGAVYAPGAPGMNVDFQSQTKGSGDKPFSLLPLAMQVAAQTVGLDLVPVVPMGGPFGMLTYLDFPYAGGDLTRLGQASGSMGGADGRIAPIMIKADLFADFNTAPVANDILFVTDGASVPVVPYRFTVVGRSRIDGFVIFKVDSNEDTAGMTYPSTFSGGNLMQSTYTIADVFNTAGWYLSTDATTGNNVLVSGSDINGFGVTPELVKALEDHVSGVTGRGFKANDVTSDDPYLREEGESTKENLMGLQLFNKSISAQTVQVAAAVTREQVQDLKQYGIDAVAQVEAVLINELTQTINKHILSRLFKLGATNAFQINSIDGTDLNLYVKSASGTNTFTLSNTGAYDNIPVQITTSATIPTSGDNTGTLQRKIMSKILAAANLIAIRGRRGAANFAVTNGQLASALQDIAGFVPYPLSNTVSQAAGSLYPIGSVAGVNIYVDPNMSWQDNRMMIGRKGDANSPGLVFMPYLMAESVQTIAEGTMAPKIAVKSRYALVEAGFFPQIYYITIGVKFEGYSII